MRMTLMLCLMVGLAARAPATTLTLRLAREPDSAALRKELKASIAFESDSERRVRLAVIYALACRYADERVETRRVERYLAQTHPEHADREALRAACIGLPCGRCSASGTIAMPCEECDGAGRCKVCGGSRRSRFMGLDGQPKPCLTCGATGKCRHCDGSGKREAACPDCAGSGFIESKARIHAIMQALAEAGNAPLPLDALKAHAYAALIRRLDEAAAAVSRAPTSVLRADAVEQLAVQGAALLDGKLTALTAVAGDIRMLPGGKAMLVFKGDYLDLEAKRMGLRHIRVFGSSLFGRDRGLKVAMDAEAMRKVLPGTEVVVQGRLKLFAAMPNDGRDIARITTTATTGAVAHNVGVLGWESYGCIIQGAAYSAAP